MSQQTFEQASVAINIAQDRRTQLEEELRALRIHIRRLEKLKAKEENFERLRAEALVMATQRELFAEGHRPTLIEAVQATVKRVGARDAAAIKKAFDGVTTSVAAPATATQAVQMSAPRTIAPGPLPQR